MSGSHNPVRDSSITLLAEALRNSSIPRSGFWDSRPMAPWSRFGSQAGGESGQIGIWAVPTLGGQARPYLEGAAEFDWSHDGSRLTYHTAASGDPLFVSDGAPHPQGQPIFTAPAGLHSHFPCGRPTIGSSTFVYGALPDKLDIWRIKPAGGMPERITSHNGRVSHPVFAESAYVDVPRQRSRRFRTVAVQHGRRTPHSSPAHLWSGPVHVTGRHSRRQAPGGHTRKSEEHPLANADRRFTRRAFRPRFASL
jgi:hypothetical protein